MEKSLHNAVVALQRLSIKGMELVIKKIAEEVSEEQLVTLGRIWDKVTVKRLGTGRLMIPRAEEWIEAHLKKNMKMEPRHVAYFCAKELKLLKMIGYLVKAAQRIKKRLATQEQRAQQRVKG